MLLLPWAGYEYLGQMSRTMMDGVAAAQAVRAQAINSYLQSRPQLFLPLLSPIGGDRVFFTQSPNLPIVDADFDEWSPVANGSEDTVARASFARVSDTLYVALQFAAPEREGIEPLLRLYTRTEIYRLLFLSGGQVVAASDSSDDIQLQDAVLGSWKLENGATQTEIALPANITGGVFGLALTQDQQTTSWGLGGDGRALSWVTEQPELVQVLDIFRVEDSQMELRTTDDLIVASSGQLPQQTWSPTLWEALFIKLLMQNSVDESSMQEQGPGSEQVWFLDSDPPALRTREPVTIGGLVVGELRINSSLSEFLLLYSAALKRFLLISLVFITLVVISLFAYSSWLSWRVRQLSGSVRRLVDERGQVNEQFPVSSAADEIGELSRAYAELTQRLKKHTSYLQGLAGRLSHEIRTPLTIIGSSLENLENATTDAERQTYSERARQGLERLRSLLRRMSEAASLEAGIENTRRQNFDPDRLIADMVKGYQQSFNQHKLHYDRASGSQIRIDGSPDLLAQLLDKLIENAVSFAPADSVIAVKTGIEHRQWFLEVSNSGPRLPAEAGADIFASLVSVRHGNAGEIPHLGLGLTIVKRIAEFHRGVIAAQNLQDGSGVVFRLTLPLSSL